MMWHRRETRRQTENTNFDLQHRENPGYSTYRSFCSLLALPSLMHKMADTERPLADTRT